MERRTLRMPILRLAYTTQFLIALIAVFFLWSEIGGQGHLDLMPWYLKLGLGTGVAYAAVKATAAAVAQERDGNKLCPVFARAVRTKPSGVRNLRVRKSRTSLIK